MPNEVSKHNALTATLMIVAVNLLPLYQVWIEEWNIVQLVLLFWLETMLVIALTAILLWLPLPQFAGQSKLKLSHSSIVFFALPFTLLQAVPLCAAYFLVDIDGVLLSEGSSFATTIGNPVIWWVLAFAFITNLLTLKRDLQANNWQRQQTHETLEVQVIGRVIAIQFVIIIGAILAIYLRQPLWILLVLVGAKIVFELLVYHFAHRERSATPN